MEDTESKRGTNREKSEKRNNDQREKIKKGHKQTAE